VDFVADFGANFLVILAGVDVAVLGLAGPRFPPQLQDSVALLQP
jgi:hypothetical protein